MADPLDGVVNSSLDDFLRCIAVDTSHAAIESLPPETANAERDVGFRDSGPVPLVE